MEKNKFEQIIKRLSDREYQEAKLRFSELIAKFINENPFMNVHESANSVHYDLDSLTNSLFEKRKPEIMNKIEANKINKILNDLESVRFLFESHDG
jgi:Fic family protein